MTHYNLGVCNPNYLGKWYRREMDAIIEQERRNDRKAAEKRRGMIRDVCQEIRDLMTQEEYNAWWAAAPEDGFLEYASDALLWMKLITCKKCGYAFSGKSWSTCPECVKAFNLLPQPVHIPNAILPKGAGASWDDHEIHAYTVDGS